jgi:hypothetical protein
MPFKKGVPHTPDEHRKAKENRNALFGPATYLVCGKKFSKYVANQRICGASECRTCYAAAKYRERRVTDPIGALGYRLSGSLRMGKGKTEAMRKLLTEAMGMRCDYCPTIITVENASLDHKTP